MNDKEIAIKVENISKCYRIGVKENIQDTFGRTLIDLIKSPINNFKKYRSLYKFDDISSNSSDVIWALKDISFEIKKGTVLGIIGRNGAGKSTLLKILSRITCPSTGRIEIRGRVSSLLEVGTGFNPELSGRENVYLNGTILGMTKKEIDSKFDEIIDFSGVEKFIDTPVKRYSSGMRVRLAFAVAAYLEPEILIIDEVLAVGDAAFQKKCLGKMDSIAKTGRTVLFVSHNMAAVANLCQKAILLQDGKVALRGETNSVINSYLERVSEKSKIKISERKDRQGAGKIKIISVEFLNHRDNVIQNPISGQEVIIRLHYKCFEDKIFMNCKVSITMKSNDQHLFRLSTDLVDSSQLNLYGEGYIDFVIPELPLSDYVYHVTTFIESDHEIQDWVNGAVEMTVLNGDFYGTGRSNFQKGTGVLVKHLWRHVELVK